MPFETNVIVRFGDVDGAGIVFYPRFFEMLNSAVEDWCAQVLELDFRTMHMSRNMGIPVVEISGAFAVPSVLGDVLTVQIVPRRVGKSSCHLSAAFRCQGEHRLSMAMTVVCMDLSARRSMPWPPEIHAKILAALDATLAE